MININIYLKDINICNYNQESKLINKEDNWQFILCDSTGYRYQTYKGFDEIQTALTNKSRYKGFEAPPFIEFNRSQSVVIAGK